MNITQHTCFTANCDECKDSYENGDCVTLHYESADEAIDEAEDCDWVSLSDGRLICDRCIKDLVARGEVERCEDDEHDHAFHLATAGGEQR